MANEANLEYTKIGNLDMHTGIVGCSNGDVVMITGIFYHEQYVTVGDGVL